MALIETSSHYIAAAVKNTIYVFARISKSLMEYQHVFDKSGSNDEVIDYILFSPSQNYFFALFSDKNLIVWQLKKDESSWIKLFQITINRRSTSAAFSPDESDVYVADKSGDLYKIPLNSVDSVAKAEDDINSILGHVSILLDVVVTEKFIVTADRDEKIRVSLREKPFVIESFCLGHTEFVCKLIPLENEHLISSSGDGTISFWNMSEGLLLSKCYVNNSTESKNDFENEKDIHRQSVPALLAYDTNLSLIAVGNVGLNDNVIFMLEASTSEPYLRKCYQIILGEDQHLIDISFAYRSTESSTLFVIIQCKEKITISSYSCTAVSYNLKQETSEVDYINSVLEKLSISDERQLHYLQLFKTTVPGHTYDAFYKKKNNQFKKDKKSKKIKTQE